jgi:hypothetical protein
VLIHLVGPLPILARQLGLRKPGEYYVSLALPFGRPIRTAPACEFQYGVRHLAQRFGLPAMRRTHSCPQRLHRQNMLAGIVMTTHMLAYFNLALLRLTCENT